MPHPHDHEVWAKAKAEKTPAFKKCKEQEKKKLTGNYPLKKPKQDDALKLALSSKLTTALVTQHHMSQINAEPVLNSVHNKAIAEGQQKNIMGPDLGSREVDKVDLFIFLIVLLLRVSLLVLALL
jgi:hypothetical protein